MSEIHEPDPLYLSASDEPRRLTQAALSAVLDLSPEALVLVNKECIWS